MNRNSQGTQQKTLKTGSICDQFGIFGQNKTDIIKSAVIKQASVVLNGTRPKSLNYQRIFSSLSDIYKTEVKTIESIMRMKQTPDESSRIFALRIKNEVRLMAIVPDTEFYNNICKTVFSMVFDKKYTKDNNDMIKTFEEAIELASNLDHLEKQERSKLEIPRPVFMNAMRVEHNSDQRRKLNFSNTRFCYHSNKPGHSFRKYFHATQGDRAKIEAKVGFKRKHEDLAQTNVAKNNVLILRKPQVND